VLALASAAFAGFQEGCMVVGCVGAFVELEAPWFTLGSQVGNFVGMSSTGDSVGDSSGVTMGTPELGGREGLLDGEFDIGPEGSLDGHGEGNHELASPDGLLEGSIGISVGVSVSIGISVGASVGTGVGLCVGCSDGRIVAVQRLILQSPASQLNFAQLKYTGESKSGSLYCPSSQ